MSAAYPQTVCSRVREQVSLELDGELSQLEQRMLGAHLERCGGCAAYADGRARRHGADSQRPSRRACGGRSWFVATAR